LSGYQPVGTELIYAYYGAGTVSVPTTTPGSSITIGFPAVPVPAGFFKNVGNWSSSLWLRGGGLAIVTATVPTWQFSLWMTTAQPATYSAAGTLVGTTALQTPTATTGCPFLMSWQLGLRTPGVVSGAGDNTSTIVCFGDQQIIPSISAGMDFTSPAAGTTYSPTCTTWPADQQCYLWPTLSLGAATAGNTVTMEWMKLYGEN